MTIYADIDGFLVDSYSAVLRATRVAFNEVAEVQLPEDVFRRYFWGKSWEHGMHYLRGGFLGAGRDRLPVLIKERKDVLLLATEWKVCPFARSLLQGMEDHHDIIICTAGSPEGAHAKLRGDTWLSNRPRMCSCSKDKSFWAGIKERRPDSIVIDDSDSVIDAAEAAGLATIHWRLNRRNPP